MDDDTTPSESKGNGNSVLLSLLLNCVALVAAPRKPQSLTKGRSVEVATVQDPEEYVVWSALLAKKSADTKYNKLVISDRTNMEAAAHPLRAYAYLSEEAFSDFQTKHKVPYALENKFGVKLPCVLLSKDAQTRIFPSSAPLDVQKIDDAWHPFYQEYPGGQGILTLSRVGFNSDKTRAVVYVTNSPSLMRSSGRYFVMANKNGSWGIQIEKLIWFS